MGQKVNPVLFRLGTSAPSITSWFTNTKESYPHLLYQDLEIRNFLATILKTRGILLRFCRISRSSQRLVIYVDLYFSFIMTKQAKFFWARSLFKTIKKKYSHINRIKDMKSFVHLLESDNLPALVDRDLQKRKKYFSVSNNRKKTFLPRFNKEVTPKVFLSFKNRFFFFLISKPSGSVRKKEDVKLLSAVKNFDKGFYKDSSLVRLNSRKFKRLFILQKFKYNFKSFYVKKFFSLNAEDDYNLLKLNKNLCRSLQHFCGVEEICLHIHSNQLRFLPSFKLYQSQLLKELGRFQKSRDLGRYFLDTVETLYFVTRTFGYGNANLLSQILVFLLEGTRKQVFIVKFLKKTLQLLFQLVPPKDLAIDGIKILIKGRFNKRRRTKKVVLQEGQISLQTISTPVDYFQTTAVTIYGTFGIKVWISKRYL